MVRRWFPRNRQRWLLRLILVLGVSGAGVWLAWAWQSHGGQTNIHATEGKRAPAFTLPSQTGDAVAWRPIWDVSRWSWFSMGDF